MDLTLTGVDAAFMQEVQEALAPFHDLHGFVLSNDFEKLRPFYRALAERNWLALAWPEAVGGLARPPLHEFLLWNEAAFRNIARPPQGVGVVAKTIIRAGTDVQKARWLDPIRKHEITFALGYSEPNAGSDLGGVQCRAVREGSRYVINGNKCWNSKAHKVDYIWLLCRTGEASAGKRGLSLFIVDTGSPGVTIRPLDLMCGNQVTEIFLDNVEVDVAERVGGENDAWSLITEALADERYVHFNAGRVRHEYFSLREWLERRGLLDDPVARSRFDELAVDVLEAEAHSLRLVATASDTSGIAASNKLAHVDVIQKIARTAMDIGGIEAAILDAPTSLYWRQTMTESVGGGTTEIMEGIVARQRLGLGGKR